MNASNGIMFLAMVAAALFGFAGGLALDWFNLRNNRKAESENTAWRSGGQW